MEEGRQYRMNPEVFRAASSGDSSFFENLEESMSSNFEVVRELINENDPAELAMQVNKAGESALFLAVDSQDYDIASHILRNAPDCSYAGRHGMNVLHALVIHTSSCKCYSNLLLKYFALFF